MQTALDKAKVWIADGYQPLVDSLSKYLLDWKNYLSKLMENPNEKKKVIILFSLLTTSSLFFIITLRKRYKKKKPVNADCDPYTPRLPSNYTICKPNANLNENTKTSNSQHFNVPLPGNIVIKDFRNTSFFNTANKEPKNNNNSNDNRNSNYNNNNNENTKEKHETKTKSKTKTNFSKDRVSNPCTIRVVTWNIERGYKLESIINELSKLDADIILLQEVDIGCERSNFYNTGCEIANRLEMQIVYATQTWHINNDPTKMKSKERELNKNIEWYSEPFNGSEGDAILTKFNIKYAYSLIMPCVRTKYKAYHADMKRHACPVAILEIPINNNNNTNNNNSVNNSNNRNKSKNNFKEVVCYSCHLDAFAGRISRSMVQYRAIYYDIMKYHMDYRSFVVKNDNLKDKPNIFRDFLDKQKKDKNHCIQYRLNGNMHGETVYDGNENWYYCDLELNTKKNDYNYDNERKENIENIDNIGKGHNKEYYFARKQRAVIIGGDFNTHNSSFVRYLKTYTGGENIGSLTENEAQWWNRNVFGNEPWYFKS